MLQNIVNFFQTRNCLLPNEQQSPSRREVFDFYSRHIVIVHEEKRQYFQCIYLRYKLTLSANKDLIKLFACHFRHVVSGPKHTNHFTDPPPLPLSLKIPIDTPLLITYENSLNMASIILVLMTQNSGIHYWRRHFKNSPA